MDFSEKMRDWSYGIHAGVKSSTTNVFRFWLRLVSGFFLSLTLALIGQELAKFGYLTLVFTTLVLLALFFRVSRKWSILALLVFDLLVILAGQILKMYIMIAP